MGDFEDIILPGEGNDPVDDNTPENGGNNSGDNSGNNNGDNNSGDDSIGGKPIEPVPNGGYVGFSVDTPTEKA